MTLLSPTSLRSDKKDTTIKELDDFIQNWSQNKIRIVGDKKSFDDLFQVESIPLWWFYRRFFGRLMMPKPINILNFIYHRKKLSLFQKLKFSLNAKLLQGYFAYNEKSKISYFRRKKFNRKNSKKKNFSGEKSSPPEKKVLFLSYSNHIGHNGEIFRIQNIINKIKTDQRIKELVLFSDPLSRRTYKKLSSYNTIYSYIDSSLEKKSLVLAKKLSQKWNNLDLRKKKKLLKKDGFSFWYYLRYPLNFFFSKRFIFSLVLYYEVMKKVIEKENVKVLVLTSQNGLLDKCALAAAKHARIPSLVIQHGIGAGAVPTDYLYCTKAAVFSDHYKKKIIKTGVPEKDVVVTGSVIFDDLKKYAKNKNSDKNEKEKNNSIRILLATAPAVENSLLSKKRYQKCINKIMADISRINNAIFFIKTHPSEKSPKFYLKQAAEKRYKNIKIINSNEREKFYKLMANCDVFLHFDSTCAVEAIILERPVINIKIFRRENISDYGGAALVATPDQDLAAIIKKAIRKDHEMKKKRRKFLKYYCDKFDGKSYERVVDLIYESLDRKKRIK